MSLSHCPWCGAIAIHVNPSGGRSGYANWGCGSNKIGNEPWQSTSCELRVAEAEIERLTRERAAVSFANQWQRAGLRSIRAIAADPLYTNEAMETIVAGCDKALNPEEHYDAAKEREGEE